MATEVDFTSLVPGPEDKSELDSELDSDPELDIISDTRTTIKPSIHDKYTSKVAPIVEEKLVKIDDDLFKKILFFTVFYPSNEDNLEIFLRGGAWFYGLGSWVIFKGIMTSLYVNKNKHTYDTIKGFIETIFVFYHYLKTINFYRNIESSKDIYNFSNRKFVMEHSIEFKYTEFIFDIKNTAHDPISLGRLDADDLYKCQKSNYMLPIRQSKFYDKIKLKSETDDDPGDYQEFPTGIATYITQKDFNTLNNYVTLLEKLIDEEIVIKIEDGELFADDIKIGYKRNCINSLRKTCRNIFKRFTRAATIGFEDNPNKVFYDTIFSIYTNPKLIAIANRNLYPESEGGRNNKTRKRHRNKASHKKMRKSHNIRKRKATGKKRK